ncbi:putative leader peptide [Nocardiopsis baichengensis]
MADVAVITPHRLPGALLTGRRHVDLARVESALCRP